MHHEDSVTSDTSHDRHSGIHVVHGDQETSKGLALVIATVHSKCSEEE